MTEIVDLPHPQPLSQIGRGEKNVDRENLKIGITHLDRQFLSRNLVAVFRLDFLGAVF
ncbi:hypothetical protein [Hydrococcus rivularis]|uniref:hypothetical protein n=1 Tax=Hydrococcus rivularis TaxID=1616834 RepID=UPI0015882256|nr:hypothetical protein [Hydrococcus rivularis]